MSCGDDVSLQEDIDYYYDGQLWDAFLCFLLASCCFFDNERVVGLLYLGSFKPANIIFSSYQFRNTIDF